MTEFKGSILEINGNQAIVMTDKCDFISVKCHPDMFVGQQISFRKKDIKTSKMAYAKYITLVAGIFLTMLCSAFLFQQYSPEKAFAYIDVDINPSVELLINEDAKVLSTKSLNADAQKLLKDLKLVNKPVKQAISEIVTASQQLGYISPEKNNAVLVSASINEKYTDKQKASQQKKLDNILTEVKTISVKVGSNDLKPEVIKVTPQNRKTAVENDISMGRYELYEKIKEKNPDITVKNAKTERVGSMLEKAGVKENISSSEKTSRDTADKEVKTNDKTAVNNYNTKFWSNDKERFSNYNVNAGLYSREYGRKTADKKISGNKDEAADRKAKDGYGKSRIQNNEKDKKDAFVKKQPARKSPRFSNPSNNNSSKNSHKDR